MTNFIIGWMVFGLCSAMYEHLCDEDFKIKHIFRTILYGICIGPIVGIVMIYYSLPFDKLYNITLIKKFKHKFKEI